MTSCVCLTCVFMIVPENDQVIITDGTSDKQFILDLFGFTSDPINLTIERKDSTVVQNIGIASRFESLPKEEISDEARRKDGYTAIVQRVELE